MILSQARAAPFDYVIIGDSITEAAYLPRVCGAPVLNAGIGGARISDAKRLMGDLAGFVHPKAIVLAIGVNDGQAKLSMSPAEDYRTLLQMARSTGATVFAATPAAVDYSGSLGQIFNRDRAHKISETITSQARMEGAEVIDLSQLHGHTIDGVHLDPTGYQDWIRAIEASVCPTIQ
jgi:lysophospholipase L1-like esterase